MDPISFILWPIKWVVELILVVFHTGFGYIGLDPAWGVTWVLSIAGLVAVVRAALIPIFVRQIKNQRTMLEIAPELKKVQDKYRGKRDQFSREAMQRETMALYSKHGTNPLASCLPLLIQMPIFFALYSVLSHAQTGQAGVGLLDAGLAGLFSQSTIFGAPLRETFLDVLNEGGGQPWQVLVVAPIMIVIMTASQFITQLQIVSRNMSDETKASPTYRTQRILLYILPFVFLVSGLAFPLGVMFYWLFSNFWTMGQQFIVIRNMPTPGSDAYRAWEARQARKQERKRARGTPEAVVEEAAPAVVEKPVTTQRPQPVSRSRAKKQGRNA